LTDYQAARFATLVAFEWRILRGTAAVWVVLVVSVVVTSVALYLGVTNYGARRRAADVAAREHVDSYDGVRREFQQPTAAGVVEAQIASLRAAVPPLPVSVVNAGSSDVLPQRYAYRHGERFSPFERTVDGRILSGLFPERPTKNPANLLLGVFDLSFLAVCVYPLFILVLTYDIATADRESGRLALIRAQPVSFRRWLAAKVTVRAGLLAVPLVLIPVVSVMVAASATASFDFLVRFTVWNVAVIAYCSLWFALAVLLNARNSSTQVNLFVAAGAWLTIVVIIPAIVNLTVVTLASPRPTLEFVVAERAASLDINPRIDAAGAVLGRVVKARSASSSAEPLALPEGAELLDVLMKDGSRWARVMPPAQLSRALSESRRELFEERLAPIVARLEAGERWRETLTDRLSMFSPALLLQSVVDDLAGTGVGRWRNFLAQLGTYIRRREEFFTIRILNSQNLVGADLDYLRPFTYQEETFAELFEQIASPFIFLVMLALFATTLAVRSTSRVG
jgi:ABC-2 type transport system permease protein